MEIGITIMRCPNCQTITGLPDWKAREYILWANQHGRCVRIFCINCGQWTDVKQLRGGETIRIVHQPVIVKMPLA
jgi:hypothetical protein